MVNTAVEVNQEKKVNYNLNLMLLILGRLISNLGTVSFNFALSLYVMDLTKSAAAFSAVLSFAILPGVFVNILAGVFVDKYDKKKIIVISDILSGVGVLIFLALFKVYSSSIFLLIMYVIVLNSLQAFFQLALNASIPNIVNEVYVPKANSAFQGLGAITNIVGPVIGALMYKTIGMEMIFLVNAISFIIAGVGETFLTFMKNNSNDKILKAKSYIENLKEVFAYVNTQKIIRFLLIVAVVLNTILNPLIYLVIQYISYNVLKVSGLQLSLIQSAVAIGTILGAVYIMTRKSTNRILQRFFILMQIQAILIILWFFPKLSIFKGTSMWVITIGYVVLLLTYGMLNAIQNVPLVTHFQIKLPENLRGRVFGVFYTALNITTPIGLWIFGFVLKKVDWAYIPVISGLLVFCICLIQSQNKHFREFVAELKEVSATKNPTGIKDGA